MHSSHDAQTAGAYAHHVRTPLLFARQYNETLRHVVWFVTARKSGALRLTYPIPAMAHDEQSLAAIAADSAAASRAWVQERLGRTDFQLSCVCPFVCVCVPVLACAALYLLMPFRTTIAN